MCQPELRLTCSGLGSRFKGGLRWENPALWMHHWAGPTPWVIGRSFSGPLDASSQKKEDFPSRSIRHRSDREASAIEQRSRIISFHP